MSRTIKIETIDIELNTALEIYEQRRLQEIMKEKVAFVLLHGPMPSDIYKRLKSHLIVLPLSSLTSHDEDHPLCLGMQVTIHIYRGDEEFQNILDTWLDGKTGMLVAWTTK